MVVRGCEGLFSRFRECELAEDLPAGVVQRPRRALDGRAVALFVNTEQSGLLFARQMMLKLDARGICFSIVRSVAVTDR